MLSPTSAVLHKTLSNCILQNTARHARSANCNDEADLKQYEKCIILF